MTQDSVEEDSNLFTFGTQVQAGLDDHNTQIDTMNFWKDKLNGFAHQNESLEKSPIKEGRIKKVTIRGKNKQGPKQKVANNKNDEDSLVKDKNFNRQRKFGSINKEVIRKYKAVQDSIEDEDVDMKFLYNREDWDSVHERLISSLKSDNEKTDKDKIVNDYTDFRQKSMIISNSEVLKNVADGTENTNSVAESMGESVRLTQHSWYPKDLTTSDLCALYDISSTGVELADSKKKEELYKNIEEYDALDVQNSGVYTLSQVLGENIKWDMDETKGSDHECIIVEDSENDSGGDDESEITFEYIEKLRSEKVKNVSGTQEVPIEVPDSSNIIEIPNSSDDEDNDTSLMLKDIILDSSNKVIVDSVDSNQVIEETLGEENEIIEIANSSSYEESDSGIILTGRPESGTQPIARTEVIPKIIELDFENADKEDHYDRMIVPTSSPVSSSGEDEFERPEIEVDEDNILFHMDFNDNGRRDIEMPILNPVIEDENENVEVEVEDTNEVLATCDEFLTAPSQPVHIQTQLPAPPVDIEERMKHYEGWSVSMLKKQLGEWGIKNSGKSGRKGLMEDITNVCERISHDRWEWGVSKTKSGEAINFTGFNGEEGGCQDEVNESKIHEQIKVVLKQDREIYYDVIRYKPLNVGRVVEIINNRDDFKEKNADRKVVCGYLDKMGIVWTDVE